MLGQMGGVSGSRSWPVAVEIQTERLVLEPLRIEHAQAMVEVVADPSLYVVTGGRPPSLDDLRQRYARQHVGQPSDGSEGWLNWIAVDTESGRAAGFVQATVTMLPDGRSAADVAWVVGVDHQRRGYATEAACAMVGFLADRVDLVTAHIAPGHRASERVAERLSMRPTDRSVDGETRWERPSGLHGPS